MVLHRAWFCTGAGQRRAPNPGPTVHRRVHHPTRVPEPRSCPNYSVDCMRTKGIEETIEYDRRLFASNFQVCSDVWHDW
jgi:hypothetical protein